MGSESSLALGQCRSQVQPPMASNGDTTASPAFAKLKVGVVVGGVLGGVGSAGRCEECCSQFLPLPVTTLGSSETRAGSLMALGDHRTTESLRLEKPLR